MKNLTSKPLRLTQIAVAVLLIGLNAFVVHGKDRPANGALGNVVKQETVDKQIAKITDPLLRNALSELSRYATNASSSMSVEEVSNVRSASEAVCVFFESFQAEHTPEAVEQAQKAINDTYEIVIQNLKWITERTDDKELTCNYKNIQKHRDALKGDSPDKKAN